MELSGTGFTLDAVFSTEGKPFSGLRITDAIRSLNFLLKSAKLFSPNLPICFLILTPLLVDINTLKNVPAVIPARTPNITTFDFILYLFVLFIDILKMLPVKPEKVVIN